MNFSLSSFFKKIDLFLMTLIPILCFIAFSSLNIYWVNSPYDGWRIYEIFILIFFGIYAIIIPSNNLNFIPINNGKKFLILSLVFILIIFSINFSKSKLHAILDISVYFLLLNSLYIIINLFKKYREYINNLLIFMSFIPLFTLIFLPLAVYSQLQGTYADWCQSFVNCRRLDDALLPCLFLLWIQLQYIKNQYPSKKIIIFFLFSIMSNLYLLSFLLNGSRAALLSVFSALLTIFIIYPKEIKNYKFIIFNIITSIILFFIIIFSSNSLLGPALDRVTSSGRIDLWKKSLNLWLENPILGIGGSNFYLHQPFLSVAHPHNFPLQLLSEWGVAGIIIIIIIINLSYKIFKERQHIPPLVFAIFIAIFINSLLSGTMIYPLTQLINIFCLALLLSYLPNKPKRSYIPTKILYKTSIALAILGIIIIQGTNIWCINCKTDTLSNTPRFWDEGHAIYLTPPNN